MLIACCIGTQIDLCYPFREQIEGLFEYPELFVSRGDVPVPELGMKNQFLFGPPDIERLICFVFLVGEQGIFFLCVNERGIGIKGSFRLRTVFLDGCDKAPVYLHESLQMLVRRGYESLALLTFLLFLGVMKGFKVPE